VLDNHDANGLFVDLEWNAQPDGRGLAESLEFAARLQLAFP
jgi:hypothetical protein